ncbi:BREX-2 system adenine-specific DNA-methyltransferase PglX [Luteipulveratus mongoliensis]|uniref:site-specific DNA-methyltransferase (adenine-specific) n=1 Tax=Luteipulveratus mongoliensis TaxID=571913 RepID=A0A0K1JE61_9MICO|nr:BREX-2 system adenine-specific DNA-methyltransferase PglX [Luteipulveratus mongoliensis]AKU14875.1 DNA methylase [Luteipulveratus mongoliensis]
MPVSSDLTADLKKVVLSLEDDLRERVEAQAEVNRTWRDMHQQATAKERTALSWQQWRDDQVTQAAVAWVLTTVFVRFCEDNALLRPVWLTGPRSRRQEALDAELIYFRSHPEHTAREWIEQAIAHLRGVKATRALVDSHSALWPVSPSGQAAKELVDFWRAQTDDGELIRDFADPELSTRFLGDLYQDLSDHAKKTYALLQTPEFVEEFILDQTMEPALQERPLDGFTLIDPTCGSGHFLLGAFARLNDKWAAQAPGEEVQARVQKALNVIHGVDLNPFAVAIARFRLIVAALRACGSTSLEDAPGFTINLAAGDSLLHGSHQGSLDLGDFDADSQISGFAYETEDLDALRGLLMPGRYDVVVGNPPYITVKDKNLNATYRALYPSCKGTYALTVPFMERFFELAKRGNGDQPAGWTGQITSNSFMKREFGSKLIETFLAKQDLRLVADTSGAYIPGHGTPTVIIVGRPQAPALPEVRAVLGVRGEPGQPKDPSQGLVWTQIVENVGSSDFDGEYVSVTDLPREALATHPWSLAGGGASALTAALSQGTRVLESVIQKPIGGSIRAGADEAFMRPIGWSPRRDSVRKQLRPLVLGDIVRDWAEAVDEQIYFPYRYGDGTPEPGALEQELWRWRAVLAARATFQGSMADAGLNWWEYMQFTKTPYKTPLSIAFAEVATHNHFVLDRGGKVFKQTAPVIKLPKEATEDDHLALLGILNSSTACFWLKQNCYPKGGDPMGHDGARLSQQPWSDRFQFNGANVSDIPLPKRLPLERSRSLDRTAQMASERFLTGVPRDGEIPAAGRLERARTGIDSMRALMIAHQEELDWEVYQSYGLIEQDLTYAGDVPEIALGERAFEIALARKVAAGEEQTAWFSRHGSTPITQIPAHWPDDYRALVQRRLDLIESDKFIRLLEKPEHKRRWASEPWDKQVEKALRSWLLDRLEDTGYWFEQGRPRPKSIGQLADQVSRDPDLVSVLELWSGKRDQSVSDALTALLTTEAVPYLAAYRLKDSGLRKREAWEHTWELQRREDAGETLAEPIPVPPKYTTADFRKTSLWQHRGKLDVPKERFVLYPDAGRETDQTLVIGWAGWDHAQQFLALATLIGEREAEGWDDERLVPLVAGLVELQPWVRQWHNEIDPTFGLNIADFCDEQLRDRAAQVGWTVDQLAAWRPAPTTRGRKKKS